MKRKAKPTHGGNKAKKMMRLWRLEGLPDMPRWSITTPEGFDANDLNHYAAAFACAPVTDGKIDARNISLWRTSERIISWCQVLTRNATAWATSDLKDADRKEVNNATTAVMGIAKEIRELCAAASRAMMLEAFAVSALVETTND